MTTDHDALLKAVIANPDEDAPRLAYADWLQEHGGTKPERAYGAYLRGAVPAARLPRCWKLPRRDNRDVAAYFCRCEPCRAFRLPQDSAARTRNRWWGFVSALIVRSCDGAALPLDFGYWPVGGFVGGVGMPPDLFVACAAAAVFAAAPVREVKLRGCEPLESPDWWGADPRVNVFGWHREGKGRRAEFALPPALFDRVPGRQVSDHEGGRRKLYATGDEALTALETGALIFGRAERDRLWAAPPVAAEPEPRRAYRREGVT